MTPLSRREFVAALGAGALTVGARPAEAVEPHAGKPPRLWIDPRLETLSRRPWRKIHQDFRNTEHVGKIATRFDPDEYGDRLLAANVDAIVTFAKDMHGYFYYPSAHGPVHPGLSFDLLGKQVEACRKRGIAVYAYYCVSWDHHLARTRPEWLVVERDGSTHLPKAGETPGWTALCLAHETFLALVEAHARELVSRYEIDGAWFDMAKPIGPECFCAECRRQILAASQDPQDAAAQRAHKHGLFVDLHRRLTTLVKQARPGCQVDYNDMTKGKEMRFQDFLKKVIVENSRMDVLADKLTKADKGKKPLFTPEELFALVVADPQTKVVEGVDIDSFGGDFSVVKKVGPYAQWIIKTYLNQKPLNVDEYDPDDKLVKNAIKLMRSQFMEDLYKITTDLQKFDRHKGKIASEFRDINKLTPEKLYDLVKDFSLEKTKASKEEKKIASQTYEHPGAEIVFRGPKWTIAKVEDKGQLGKDAACFYGGNQLEPSKGETRWCTSAPGLSWFDRYIKDGPLYEIEIMVVGSKTAEPPASSRLTSPG